MRIVKALAVATGLLLAGTTLPALAGSPDAAPSPAEFAAIRERVGRRDVRLLLRRDAYDIRGAQFAPQGVAFAPGDLSGVPVWVPAWENSGGIGEHVRPAPLPSPIGWNRIYRITVQKPCALRGALVGGLVGTVAYAAIIGWASHNGDEIGMGAVVGLALVPIGSILGGTIGALSRRSEPVWQRGTDRSAPAPVAPR